MTCQKIFVFCSLKQEKALKKQNKFYFRTICSQKQNVVIGLLFPNDRVSSSRGPFLTTPHTAPTCIMITTGNQILLDSSLLTSLTHPSWQYNPRKLKSVEWPTQVINWTWTFWIWNKHNLNIWNIFERLIFSILWIRYSCKKLNPTALNLS